MSPKFTIPPYIQALQPTSKLNFIDLYKKAAKLNEKIKPNHYKKKLNEKIKLANEAFQLGHLQEFTIQTLSTINLASKWNDIEPQITGFCNLGILYQNKRIYDVALAFAQEGYNLANGYKLLEMKITALKAFSLIYTNLHNRQKMVEVYEEIADIHKALGQFDQQQTELQKIAKFKEMISILGDSPQKNQLNNEVNNPMRPTPSSKNIVLKVNVDEAKKAMDLGSMGDNASKQGDHKKALICYKKILEFRPKDAAAWLSIGHEYFELGDNEKAIEASKKAVELNPKNLRALNVLGDLYRKLGNKEVDSFFKKKTYFEEALNVTNRCLELKPNSEDFQSLKKGLENGIKTIEKQKANKDVRDALSNRDNTKQITLFNPESMELMFKRFKETLALKAEGIDGINIREIIEKQLVIVQPENGDPILYHTSIKSVIGKLLQNMEYILNHRTEEIAIDLSVSTQPCFCCYIFIASLNRLFSKTKNLNHLKIKSKAGDLTEPEENYLRLHEFETQMLGFFDSLGAHQEFMELYTILASNRINFKNFIKKKEVLKKTLLHQAVLKEISKLGLNLNDYYVISI